MTPEEEIKQFGLQRGAEQAGIASVADINRYAPPGHRPDDILTGAKSVVVFAGHTTLQGAWRSPDYRTHYSNRTFPRIRSGIAMAVAKFIESRYGYYSLAEIPPTVGFNPSLSLKLCAEMAGLGTRSMAAAILLNHELGLLSLAACITTMPLVADGPMKESVCPHPSCVELWERRRTIPCLETCPECLSGELDGEQIKWMRYDRRICSTRAQTEGMSTLLRTLVEGINQPDPEVRRSVLLGSFSRSVIQAIASGGVVGQCGECLRHCPICIQARRLKVKKLNPDAVS
jgi:hypothetical protein